MFGVTDTITTSGGQDKNARAGKQNLEDYKGLHDSQANMYRAYAGNVALTIREGKRSMCAYSYVHSCRPHVPSQISSRTNTGHHP